MSKSSAVLFLLLSLALCPCEARAEAGTWNLELNLGGAALLTDTAAPDVKRFGLDLAVKADMPLPMFPMVAPQIQYAFDFLPGKSGIHSVMAGVRARVLEGGPGFALSPLWPSSAPKGGLHGNFYVEGNLGYVHAPTVAGDSNWFGFSLGVGYQMAVASPLHVGAYVRYQQIVFKGAKDPIFLTFGVAVSFGWPKEIMDVKEAPPPDEPPEEMAEPNLVGKPGDQDGDGVPDEIDLCPITAPGVEVDERGCMVLRGRMMFPEILFYEGRTRLPGKALLQLKRLADTLNANSNVYVQVYTYADEEDSATENMMLADKRAERIKEWLVKFGVQTARIKSSSGPAERPPPGREKPPWWERRVDFRFRIHGP